MKEKIAPIIFSHLLNIYGGISTYEIDGYKELSTEEPQQSIIFYGLGSNLLQIFGEEAS